MNIDVTKDQIRTLFNKYDTNKNNSMSFGEFSKMVEHAEEHGAITDTSHWAYPLIENFRRRHTKKKKSIIEIFKADYRKGDSSCFVSWDNFYEVFEGDQYISPEIKKKLKALLDVKANNDRVDLMAFQCLVGIALKPAKRKDKSGRGSDSARGGSWQGERQLVRELMQRLSKARIDNLALRRDLKLAANKRNTVDRETFIELIVGSVEIYQDQKAEKGLEKAVAKIATKFPAEKYKGAESVNYEQFVEVYGQYEELFKATALIFRQFDTLMEKHGLKSKNGKIPKDAFETLLSKYTKKSGRGKLSADETRTMFTTMLLRLEDWELDLVCEEFDPTGKGNNIDLDHLQF